MHATALKLNQLAEELKSAFYERDEVVDALVLSMIAGRHIMLLGVPGVAKTNVARHLFHAIDGARKFEVQLSKRTPNEKVQGPIDLVRLREEGAYLHKRAGYVTDVELAILDELGKASPVTGHDLLTLLADGMYHEVNDQGSVHKAPLHFAVCPSNEIPTHESDENAALWDRILMRVVVEDVKDKRSFLKLLTADVPLPTTRIEFDEIKKITEVELPQIGLSQAAGEAMVSLRDKFAAKDISLSARRWRWSMDILRAAAFMSGAKEIEEEHLVVLRHTLWDEYEQIEIANQLCSAASNPFYEELQSYQSLLSDVEKGFRDRAGDETAIRLYVTQAVQNLAQVRRDLDTMLTNAGDRKITGFAPVADRHRSLLIRAYMEGFDQPEDVATISAERGLGLGGGTVAA